MCSIEEGEVSWLKSEHFKSPTLFNGEINLSDTLKHYICKRLFEITCHSNFPKGSCNILPLF